MDIVIIANFCGDFSVSDNYRFSYLANLLSDRNEVEVITSDYFHSTKEYRNGVPNNRYKITLLHEPEYRKNVSLKRFFSHFIWGHNVIRYIRNRKRPDVIYCAVPSLTGPYLISRFCKKKRIRFVVDIQDLWPDAFKMVFNIPVLSDCIFGPLSLIASSIYKNASSICTVSETYMKKVIKNRSDLIKHEVIYLGTDLSTYDSYSKSDCKIEKGHNDIWIGYCGTLGASYDINCVIDAISIIHIEDVNISLIIMGDGNRLEEFKQNAREKGVSSIFTGRLPYNEMCATLSRCDIVVNPIAHGSAGSIINKHADYAASGLPVVNTQENEEYRGLVDKYRMGINCNNGDPIDVSEKISMLINNPDMRSQMGKNARKCAEDCFDRRNTYSRLVSLIEGD